MSRISPHPGVADPALPPVSTPGQQPARLRHARGTLVKQLVVLLFCLFGASVAFSAPMSEDEFARAFADKVRAEMKGAQVQIVQPLQVNVTDADGHELTAFLHNAYAKYKADPAALDWCGGSAPGGESAEGGRSSIHLR